MNNTIMHLQTLKGFRDFLPHEKRQRDYVLKKIIEIFEQYGFEPLETPTLEYASLLLGKYGDEADKLVYTFKDKGERHVGLRYDQTVPTARVLAQYGQTLPKYFRRYQTQNVFRADKPQKGRFREFTQCDLDIFGSTSPVADAEILACTYFAFKNIGYPNFTIKINDRQTLFTLFQPFAPDNPNFVFSIIQSVDKLDKHSSGEVIAELIQKGLSQENAKKVLEATEQAHISENIQTITDTAINLGIPKENLIFSPSLARGLDYYTGMIFEVLIDRYTVGSCGGGGRFDNLVETLGGKSTPAVGAAFGFDRMVEAANELHLFPETISEAAKVFVTIYSKEIVQHSLHIASLLRSNTIPTELWVGEIKEKNPLEKQLKYADEKNIPFVIILGPQEKETNTITLKNLKTREQKQLPFDEALKILQQ